MRKVFLLITLSVVAIFSLMFVTPNISVQKEKSENGITEAQEIAGTIEWWNNVRSNGESGIFDPQDVYAATAQANSMSSSRDITIQWEEAGPDNVGGRTRAVLWDRNNPSVVFAGGVSGGLWKSQNYGDSWTQVTGDFSVNTVSCIAQAINGDIYFGTGEGFFDLSLNVPTGISAPGFPGQGIWKSSDAGATWTHLSATIPSPLNSITAPWAYVQKIACSPNDANRIYAATNKGLQISIDAGTTWFAATGTNNVLHAWDVKTGSDGYVYAITGNQYYRSNDPDGNSFQNRQGQSGYPPIGTGRTELAVSPTNPSYVYSVVGEPGLSGGLMGVYKSTDGGLSWTLIGPGNGVSFNPLGQQAFYDITCAVLPSDPDVLFVGGQLSLYKYTPTLGWYTVTNASGNYFDPSLYVHPDMHTIVFNPNNSAQFIIGTDGGVFRTSDADDTYPIFESLDRNYNVTQGYGVAAKLTGEMLMGSQDNGPCYIDFLGNTTKAASTFLIAGISADCMNVAIARTNQKAFFVEAFDALLARSSNNGESGTSGFFDTRIDADGDHFPDESADWVAPLSLWEAGDTSHSFFALGCNSHAWITLGALNFSSNPDWFQLPLTSGAVTCTAFSPDGNNLFVGTSTGNLYRYGNLQQVYANNKFHYATINSTASSWHAVDSGITVSSKSITAGRYLRSIAIDPHNGNNVVVTAARYGYTSYIWRSTNAEDSIMFFSDITSNLPDMPVWSSCIDYVNPNLILVGTDLGVYSRDLVNGTGWVEQNSGMDRVPVLQIIQVPYYGQTDYTYLGTYGRGIFRSASLVGINDVKDNAIINAFIFPNPVKDQATLQINLQRAGDLIIRVYDLNGTEMYRKVEAGTSAGNHSYTIPVKNLLSGTYLVNVSAGSSSSSHKMVVMK
ncbi:MAG TPA: T9SS type A sorting domain-containing protein [Chitinophagales bacterium]|nr:T9SS type A sorting domain-containing protein [Chitinophagales bacterium]